MYNFVELADLPLVIFFLIFCDLVLQDPLQYRSWATIVKVFCPLSQSFSVTYGFFEFLMLINVLYLK